MCFFLGLWVFFLIERWVFEFWVDTKQRQNLQWPNLAYEDLTDCGSIRGFSTHLVCMYMLKILSLRCKLFSSKNL